MNTSTLIGKAIDITHEIKWLVEDYPEIAKYDKLQRLIRLSNEWMNELNICLNQGNKEVSHV